MSHICHHASLIIIGIHDLESVGAIEEPMQYRTSTLLIVVIGSLHDLQYLPYKVPIAHGTHNHIGIALGVFQQRIFLDN